MVRHLPSASLRSILGLWPPSRAQTWFCEHLVNGGCNPNNPKVAKFLGI